MWSRPRAKEKPRKTGYSSVRVQAKSKFSRVMNQGKLPYTTVGPIFCYDSWTRVNPAGFSGAPTAPTARAETSRASSRPRTRSPPPPIVSRPRTFPPPRRRVPVPRPPVRGSRRRDDASRATRRERQRRRSPAVGHQPHPGAAVENLPPTAHAHAHAADDAAADAVVLVPESSSSLDDISRAAVASPSSHHASASFDRTPRPPLPRTRPGRRVRPCTSHSDVAPRTTTTTTTTRATGATSPSPVQSPLRAFSSFGFAVGVSEPVDAAAQRAPQDGLVKLATDRDGREVHRLGQERREQRALDPTHDHVASLSLHVSTRPVVDAPGGTKRATSPPPPDAIARDSPGGDVFSRFRRLYRPRALCPAVPAGSHAADPGSFLYRNAICPSFTALQLGRPWSSDPGGVSKALRPSTNRSFAPLAHRLTVALPQGAEDVYRWKVTEGRTRYRSPARSSTDHVWDASTRAERLPGSVAGAVKEPGSSSRACACDRSRRGTARDGSVQPRRRAARRGNA